MKTNARAAGVDGRTVAQTAELLAARQEDILALISAGRYRPEAVKAVDIPKVNGGTRRLGIPTVLDRPIQKAVHQTLDMCVPSRLPPRIRPTTCSWRLLSTNGRRPPPRRACAATSPPSLPPPYLGRRTPSAGSLPPPARSAPHLPLPTSVVFAFPSLRLPKLRLRRNSVGSGVARQDDEQISMVDDQRIPGRYFAGSETPKGSVG